MDGGDSIGSQDENVKLRVVKKPNSNQYYIINKNRICEWVVDFSYNGGLGKVLNVDSIYGFRYIVQSSI